MTKEQSILTCYHSLRAARVPWESWWDTLRHYVLPSRMHEEESVPDAESHSHALADTTAVEACQKLASGHMSYMTPSDELWFKWESPLADAGDETQSWYNLCSEIALRELAMSNFYTELHECFLDRVGLGTGALYCGTSRSGRLLFRHIPCGEFMCDCNDEGEMDTFIREFTLSPHQAALQFGEKNLGPRARDLLAAGHARHEQNLRFIHLVRPREQRSRRRESQNHMPLESIYYSMDDNICVEESGYREMPYMVTRFLKWGSGAYGLAPARLVYPDIRQAQFLNRILDMLGEIAAFPRILELASQSGEVDLRAGGRTLINPESASLGFPREWATQGRYDVGVDRLKQKQEAINRAFFVPMLELWSHNKQQLTASEVYARENERVMLFSPSFTLFSVDFRPMMERIFAQLFRLGKFPKPPESALRTDRQGESSISEPRAIYQGRIAMVMRRLQSEGLDRALLRLQQMGSQDPTLADHLDMEKAFRMATRLDGVPESVLRPQHAVNRLRKRRDQEAAEQQEQLRQLATAQANPAPSPAAPAPPPAAAQPFAAL